MVGAAAVGGIAGAMLLGPMTAVAAAVAAAYATTRTDTAGDVARSTGVAAATTATSLKKFNDQHDITGKTRDAAVAAAAKAKEEAKEEPPAADAAVFVQLVTLRAAPPTPPDTWGAYSTKDGKSNGVIALIENLQKELKDDGTEAKHDEETSQKDYERLMTDSQENRAQLAEIGRAHV